MDFDKIHAMAGNTQQELDRLGKSILELAREVSDAKTVVIPPHHDGKLDEKGRFKASFHGSYICFEYEEREGYIFKAAQALSLLAWLEQEKATLERMAKEDEV